MKDISVFRKKAESLVSKMTLDEKLSQLCNEAPRIDRLDIPAFDWWSEACHGSAWSGDASLFPHSIAMAATFDAPLIRKLGDAISTEIRAKHNDIRDENGDSFSFEGLLLCSPNINIARDPRWGRTQETFGEDPYLTGVMATAYIEGMQGDGYYLKTAATLKHFAVHSGPEPERHSFSAYVNDRDLYETYLAAFRYCLEHTFIAAVMSAYNGVNGVPITANRRMMQEILREEFGFDGLCISDAGSVSDLIKGFKICKTAEEAASTALNCGVDLELGGGNFSHLKDAIEQGLTTEERVTEACIRAMTLRYALGLHAKDDPYDRIPYSAVRCEAHKKLNLKAATDSIVLLKNDGILPLSKDSSVAVIGPAANNLSFLRGNYSPLISEYSTPYTGIKKASHAPVYWAEGCRLTDPEVHPWNENHYRSAIAAARRSDVVILTLGFNESIESEFYDKKEYEINYPPSQTRLLREILALKKPTVLVNVSGSCVDLSEADAGCNAVLQMFYAGECGGDALASVLYGDACPSARLPLTFYKTTEDLPAFTDYSMEGRTYKYYKGVPLYPFGHGLSYTDFLYRDIERSENDVNLTLHNTGKYDAAHSVLLYGEKHGVWHLIAFSKAFVPAGDEVKVKLTFDGDYTKLKLGEEQIV